MVSCTASDKGFRRKECSSSQYHDLSFSPRVDRLDRLSTYTAVLDQQTRRAQPPVSMKRPNVSASLCLRQRRRQAGGHASFRGARRHTNLSISNRGMRGVLVETLSGQALMSESADQAFNPASGVKLATALAAIRTFGVDHRFTTGVWTNGTLDTATGTLVGNLIISGRDPSFHYEHAVMLARELNRHGIRSVTGDLIIAPRFTMNFDWSAQHSGDMLYDPLDLPRRQPRRRVE